MAEKNRFLTYAVCVSQLCHWHYNLVWDWNSYYMLYNIFEKLYAMISLDAIRINLFHSSFMSGILTGTFPQHCYTLLIWVTWQPVVRYRFYSKKGYISLLQGTITANWELCGLKTLKQGFPVSSVVKNQPVNGGGTGSIPGPEKSHMPWEN